MSGSKCFASEIYTQISSWKQPPSAKINNIIFRGTYFRYASLDIHCNALEKFLENTIEVQISTQPYLKRMPLSGDNFSTYVIAYFRCVIYILLRTFFIYVSKTTGYGCIAKNGRRTNIFCIWVLITSKTNTKGT